MFVWISYGLIGFFCSPYSHDMIFLSTYSGWRCGKSPWSAGCKTSDLGPKSKMSLMSEWFFGNSSILFEQWDCQTYWNNWCLGAMNCISDWHCRGARRCRRCSEGKICETAKRVSVVSCLWIFLCYLAVVLCGEIGQENWQFRAFSRWRKPSEDSLNAPLCSGKCLLRWQLGAKWSFR